MALLATQAALLKEREEVLSSLGLDQLRTSGAIVSHAAKEARKRGLKRRAEAAPAGPVRRSLRAQGIAADGSAIVHEALYTAPTYEERARPEGDVLWSEILSPKSNATVAQGLLEAMRSSSGLPEETQQPLITPAKAGATADAAPPPPATLDSPRAARLLRSGTGAGSSPSPQPAARAAQPPAARRGGGSVIAAAEEEGEEEEEGKGAAAKRKSKQQHLQQRRGGGGGAGGEERPVAELARLTLTDPRYVMKVVPDRIYDVHFHPGAGRLVALCGSKAGALGLWCPDAGDSAQHGAAGAAGPAEGGSAGPTAAARRVRKAAAAASADDEGGGSGGGSEDDSDDDGGAATVAVFQPHTGPINHFRVPAAAPHLVVTGSYDGSVRALDVHAGASLELFADADGGVSALDVDTSNAGAGVALWVGAYSGRAFHVDSRQPRQATGGFAPHDRKITALSVLPSAPHYFVTATSAASVCLWDARKLLTGKSGASPKPVAELVHGLSVTSACFSSGGRRLVTTSNDNRIRVFDVRASAGSASPLPEHATTSFAHDNRTGRWLTAFKTVFDPANEGVCVVGEMGSHRVQLWDAASGTLAASLASELLNAVPTLNAVHPSPHVHAVVSATASGRLFMWR